VKKQQNQYIFRHISAKRQYYKVKFLRILNYFILLCNRLHPCVVSLIQSNGKAWWKMS